MTKVRNPQTNFTAGVVDPELMAREDLTYYYNALRGGNNIIVDPRGGVKRRPGSRRVRKLMNQLTQLDVSGATYTNPHGGTIANLYDGDDTTLFTTTDNLSNTNPFVVFTVDLGAALPIAAIDILNYKLGSGAVAGEFRVQWSTDNVHFFDFATDFDWDATSRSRRLRDASGDITARYLQLVRIGTTNIADVVNVAEFRVWQQSANLSDVALMPFSYSDVSTYMLAATDKNVEVFTGSTYQASASMPHNTNQIGVVNYTQSLDTMLLFHGAVQPWKIFRQGGDDEFDFRNVTFTKIPQNDYGQPGLPGSPGVNEVQTITATFVSGDQFTLTLNGKTTGTIRGQATQASVASAIQSALRYLPNTSSAGITVARVGSTYVVTFAGADGNKPWDLMTVNVTQGTDTATVARTTPGSYPGASANNETQVINISAALAASTKFTLLLEGKRTKVINGDATPANVAANIKAALEALPNLGAGQTAVTSVTDGYQVIFQNGAGNRPWLPMDITILAGTQICDVARTNEGQFPGEDIMSDLRGWPRCGTFYQERLYLGGIPGVPNATIASVVSSFFTLDTTLDDPTVALLFRGSGDTVSSIFQIVPARHLTYLCNDAEFYVPNEPIDKNAVLKGTTNTGTKEGLRGQWTQGAVLFLGAVRDDDGNEIGTAEHEYIFDLAEQSYKTNNLSKLSMALIKNPVGYTLQKGAAKQDADITLMVNDDGTGTAHSFLRDEQINAYTPLSTRDGDKWIDCATDKRRRVFWASERIINGSTVHFLEVWDESMYFDCGDIIDVTAETYTATDGQTVFDWTFDAPGSADAIGVRINGARLLPAQLIVDLAGKSVTVTACAAGDTVRIASMINTISGVGDLEGETVQTYIDGSPADDCVVTGGVITLPFYSDTEVQYGFDFDVELDMMPYRIPGQQTLAGLKVRVSGAVLNLLNCSPVEIKANDGDWQEPDLQSMDDLVLDRSQDELLKTGEFRLQGLQGYAVGAPFSVRQAAPGPFTILSITREVSL